MSGCLEHFFQEHDIRPILILDTILQFFTPQQDGTGQKIEINALNSYCQLAKYFILCAPYDLKFGETTDKTTDKQPLQSQNQTSKMQPFAFFLIERSCNISYKLIPTNLIIP